MRPRTQPDRIGYLTWLIDCGQEFLGGVRSTRLADAMQDFNLALRLPVGNREETQLLPHGRSDDPLSRRIPQLLGAELLLWLAGEQR
jgi:hypothetical protein